MSNYSTKDCISQDDKLDEEILQKFTPKRKNAELLSASYKRIGEDSKSERVLSCGTFLEFHRPILFGVAAPLTTGSQGSSAPADGWKLKNANFCRDRLCPMCSWRRTYKIFGQISQIMNVIQDDYEFIFLTLTVPNCTSEKLPELLDKLQQGWHLLTKNKRFKRAVKGYFKALEVTRNKDPKSKDYGTYHPHFHCILAVNKTYFAKSDYISHSEWLSMWRSVMQDPTIKYVNIKRCYVNKAVQDLAKLRAADGIEFKPLASAIAETAKYSVKDADYIFPNDDDTTDEVVSVLGCSLRSRRLCSFGGVIERTRKALNLDDVMDGDLIHIDGSELRPDVEYMIRRYAWSAGAYKMI